MGFILEGLIVIIISLLFGSIIFLPLIILAIVRFIDAFNDKKEREEYEKTAYYQSTKLPFNYVMNDAGVYGEYCTYRTLERCALPNTKFLFNVYVPTGANKTTEIDIIMLSPMGIIVVESKNLGGWVFGHESQKNWCHTMRNGQKNFFYNPIMQNGSHIWHLKTVIGNEFPIYSLIVFSDRCTLKDVQVNRDDVYVTYHSNVPGIISTINAKNATIVLSDKDIAELYERLLPLSQVGDETKAQHLLQVYRLQFQEQQKQREIQSQKIEDKRKIASDFFETGTLKCPRCNGDLVVRSVKKGSTVDKRFYGCSRFPECKYTREVSWNDFWE